MISDDHVCMMARYNRWQNGLLLDAAETLDDAARNKDRGAFWGSIAGTLSHLLWGDWIWMSRFDGGDAPPVPMSKSIQTASDWADFKQRRTAMDDRIDAWALQVGDIPSDRMLRFHSASLNAEVNRSLAMCVTHFFNHQTHHRGQVHAMLTAAGAKTGDTDLFLMPDAG